MINEFGLYRNKVKRYRIPGLKSDRYDDQTNGWWLPFYDADGNIHLVDTYHILSDYADTLRFPERRSDILSDFIESNTLKKDNTSIISQSNNEFYYGGSVLITDVTEKCFELVCDLRDYEIRNFDVRDYSPDDMILNVELYNEHAFPSGVSLLKKGAEKIRKSNEDEYDSYNGFSIQEINTVELFAENRRIDINLRAMLKNALKETFPDRYYDTSLLYDKAKEKLKKKPYDHNRNFELIQLFVEEYDDLYGENAFYVEKPWLCDYLRKKGIVLLDSWLESYSTEESEQILMEGIEAGAVAGVYRSL